MKSYRNKIAREDIGDFSDFVEILHFFKEKTKMEETSLEPEKMPHLSRFNKMTFDPNP